MVVVVVSLWGVPLKDASRSSNVSCQSRIQHLALAAVKDFTVSVRSSSEEEATVSEAIRDIITYVLDVEVVDIFGAKKLQELL
ncbi:hypothetical protein TorRG33x02_308600 [Trema orientale]|uniref:Uncharacterized protein n=1 Tax=Trema orientale TaxID=63057 RepID=A0A2P5BU61_TREOI|nr:hypothetical protein TorRG33x02_308600 [Trema orientale]